MQNFEGRFRLGGLRFRSQTRYAMRVLATAASENPVGDARATTWDGHPRPSDCRKRLGNWLNSSGWLGEP
jgi:hypothetical protein